MTTTHPWENVAGSAPEHQDGPTSPARSQRRYLRSEVIHRDASEQDPGA